MEFYNQFDTSHKSDARPISSHNFFSSINYVKDWPGQRSKFSTVDIGRVYDFYKSHPQIDYYNTLAWDHYDSMWERSSVYATLVITVLDDYLQSISATKSTTSTKVWYMISSLSDPYKVAEVFDSEWNLVNQADFRAWMVSVEDINHHLTKYL
jgi:hypothetical protein